ncbi:MAG: hypothetical protein HY077_13290 [Elusimicrobia bacterium]|nr:hypothetical protein [Elusimicrobiota bacterium]
MSKRTLRLLGLLALIVLRAPARVPAWAQFSTPYDPDFAPDKTQTEQKAKPETENPPAETTIEPEETPIILPPSVGPFLLLDRADPAHIFEAPPAVSTEAAKPHDFVDFEKKLRTFSYSQEKWNAARDRRERGINIEEGPIPSFGGEGIAISTSAPKPPPPEVELPTYGTSLSVTGRKVIGMTFNEKRFLAPQTTTGRPQTTNLFDIQQQLQLRMQGKVGPKITVNVDYDDTKQNHQDISVVYTGDPGEVVQNVSFGDIDLSLPATEFVSYNKQLFGIRADVKYKGVKASFVGSRTKGQTKSKQFFGNTQFVAQDVIDTAYLRRQYYDVSFGNPARLPLKVGSEQVYLATNVPGQANTNTLTFTADDIVLRSSSFTGVFQQLNAGQDYNIDYTKGIITFRTPMQPNFVLAVDLVDATGQKLSVENGSTTIKLGGTGLFKLIKTVGDVPIECSSCTLDEAGYNRELKTFYSIGQQQIVPDNGRGNFILKVLDLNRLEVGPTLNPIQKYPDTINVDFANGLFNLLKPFAIAGDSSTIDPDVYSPTPINKRLIHVEFSFRFKTFFLEPNLVAQSEVVLLDQQKLNRNVDYFIDYDAGFITFFNEDRIREHSEIDISYEVSPFAGITNESLLGTRVSYDIGKRVTVGTTLLYQAGSKSPTTPAITELAKSLLVYDFDSQVKDVALGKKLKLKSAAGEIAQSRQDLNLNSFAIIDNMEGIRQEDTVSTFAQQWIIASNPPISAIGSSGVTGTGVPVDPTHFSLQTEDIPVLTINPRAQATAKQTQKVLAYNYGPLAVGEEASIVFPFSVSGVDFSHRTILEVVMNGDASSNLINFHLGQIDENSDGRGGMLLNCTDGRVITNAPKSEDINCDGILQSNEDVGWTYAPTSGPGAGKTLVIGAGNGRIDSQDLNGNGRLDPQDFSGSDFGYMGQIAGNGIDQNNLPEPGAGNHTKIDFGGNINTWTTLQIPLNISSATLSSWNNVRQLRLTIKRAAAGTVSSTVRFARIAVVGNTWLPGAPTDPAVNSPTLATEGMVVTPINNVDNPTYVPIFNAGGDATNVFDDLYGSLGNLQKQSNTTNISEQALQMSFFNLFINPAGTQAVVTTKRVFPRAIDISQHRFFNFLVFGNAAAPVNKTDHTFFLRVGNDTNFFEVRLPLNFTGWKKVRVRQTDSRRNSVADGWESATPGAVIISSGQPSLQQVAEIVAGVRRTASVTAGADATLTSGTVWLDEIHVAEPLPRVGIARKMEMNFEVPGWASFGGKYREVDRNFQTPTSVVSNQDNRQDSGYLNYTRISYFPMSFNLSRSITDTPSSAQTGTLSNLTTLLQQGKVTTWTGTANGSFSRGALPRLSVNYTRNRISYDLLTRLDDRNTYNTTLQYGVPVNSRFLPKTIDGNYSWSRYDVKFDNLVVRRQPGNFNTDELSQSLGGRLSFLPWTGSSFNPDYALSKVSERRDDFTSPIEKHLHYNKSLHEGVGFSSNFRLLSWLNPQVNYKIDILENNILNVSTFIVSGSTFVFDAGDIKTVNRNANGSISLPITIGDIFHKTKLWRSMNIVSGYQLQDGDVWNQVENHLNTTGELWVRTPLHPKGAAAVLQSQTLRDTYNSTQRWSPLDAYDIRGRLSAFKTISISNNYVRSIQRQNVTGTLSKTISTTFPDIIASMSQLEKLWFTERWMANTQMNAKYSEHKILNIGQTLNRDQAFGTDLRAMIVKRFDSLVGFNARQAINENLIVEQNTQKTQHQDATAQTTFDIRKFRFTPKVDYAHDFTALGTGVKTQDVTVVTPSALVRADLALPRGLLLPGTTKPILFSNRIIWTNTVSLALRSSPVTVADNFKLLSFNTSGDYELAKNLRMTLNGAFSREWHKFLPQEDFISYSFGTTLTFQF